MSSFASEVATGERFEFGANWSRFLTTLTEERVATARASMQTMLEQESLTGKRFLDIGSGSGLFSLTARQLGAQVVSVDFDPQSVACAQELKRRYYPEDADWRVMEGSVLDDAFLESLGEFDIVYSWGVLHHTGAMWKAIENAARRVKPTDGTLFIAIYNDQGWASKVWFAIKKTYNALPPGLRFLVLYPCALRLWGPTTIKDLLKGRPGRSWRNYKQARGMSPWHDVVDWVGGYPFEVASVERLTEFLTPFGFQTRRAISCGKGHGCNELVMSR